MGRRVQTCLPGIGRMGSLCLHAVHQIRQHAGERRNPDAGAHQQQHLKLLRANVAGVRIRGSESGS